MRELGIEVIKCLKALCTAIINEIMRGHKFYK